LSKQTPKVVISFAKIAQKVPIFAKVAKKVANMFEIIRQKNL